MTSRAFPILLLVACWLLASPSVRAQTVNVTSDPPGATVEIINVGKTRVRTDTVFRAPRQIELPRRAEAYVFRFTLPDHETKEVPVQLTDRTAKSVHASLARLRQERTYEVTSEPAGAEVLLNGTPVGTTPLRVPVGFQRYRGDQPWPSFELAVRLPDHQAETRSLAYGDSSTGLSLALVRLRQERVFQVAATNEQGQPIEALVAVDGRPAGKTPLALPLVFERSAADRPFPEFTVSAGLPDYFQERTAALGRESTAQLTFVLPPITERRIPLRLPSVLQTPSGPVQGIDLSERLAVFDQRDENSPASNLRPVTAAGRQGQLLQSVNSFCLTPDGQSLLYSLTTVDAEGNTYANLHLKEATDLSMATTQLTRGNRFLDCFPAMGREPTDTLVVFQSNRGPLNSWDISSFRLVDRRLVGGIQQLTRDNRLNFSPTFVGENQPVFFASSDIYPEAEPFISYVRPDGSSYTNMNEVGRDLHRAADGTIYFTRPDEATGKLQIFSINASGLEFSAIINDVEFSQANCFSPYVSTDGTRLLFVSDYRADAAGRPNHDIYLLTLASGRIQQLTDNGSDDLQPAWSPSEPDVLFFLSNRGRDGVYNVWRMTLPRVD